MSQRQADLILENRRRRQQEKEDAKWTIAARLAGEDKFDTALVLVALDFLEKDYRHASNITEIEVSPEDVESGFSGKVSVAVFVPKSGKDLQLQLSLDSHRVRIQGKSPDCEFIRIAHDERSLNSVFAELARGMPRGTKDSSAVYPPRDLSWVVDKMKPEGDVADKEVVLYTLGEVDRRFDYSLDNSASKENIEAPWIDGPSSKQILFEKPRDPRLGVVLAYEDHLQLFFVEIGNKTPYRTWSIRSKEDCDQAMKEIDTIRYPDLKEEKHD